MRVCICVYFFWTETELRSRLLAEFEAKWISISPMSAPFTVTARWHGTVWRPRPTWCPPSPFPPTPHPGLPAVSQTERVESETGWHSESFLGFFLRLRARWLSTKVVLVGTVSSSGYGNNYLLNKNKTVTVKHDPLPEEYSTIFRFFFFHESEWQMVPSEDGKNLLKVTWFWLEEIVIFHAPNTNIWSNCRFLTIKSACQLVYYSSSLSEARDLFIFPIFFFFFNTRNLTRSLCRRLLHCLSSLSSRATDPLPPSSLLSSSTTSAVSCRPSQAMLTLLSGWLIARRIVVNSLAND